jgi:protein-S-isoprenylcysteine O-methyltransferase Ste14
MVCGQNPRLTTRFLIDSWAMKILFPSIVLPVVVLFLYFLLPGVKEHPWTVLRISGVIIALLGYVLVTVARVQLGDSFTVQPEARELVTQGFYARIRNPMYVFLDIMVLGLIIVFQTYWFLVALAVLVVMQVMQSRREAKVLEGKFGQCYLAYRNETWF